MLPELAPVAFIAAFSLLLPLPWHWRARNLPTLSIIGWLFALNMIYAIDAVIWANNVQVVATVWCDITTKLIIGANFALPAACLCICIHLERVASMRSATTTVESKRRRVIFEAMMCWGLPIVFMALHYIVQGHRFDIIEDYGCRATTYFSIPSIFIVYLPSILMSVGALVFSGLALRHFIIRRLSFATHLSSSNSALSTSRYIRLMAMSAVQMFWILTTTSYALWFTTISIPLRPWTTWADVHSDFLRIDAFPAAFMPPLILRTFYVLWWLPVASTFLFVAFFSFGKDATDEYKKCFFWIKTRFPRLSPPSKGFMKFSNHPKTELPISSPVFLSSSNPAASCTLRTSNGSHGPFSPSSDKTKTFGADDSSEITHYLSGTTVSYYKGAKAVGSIRDLSAPQTPSTALPLYYQEVIETKSDLDSKPLPKLPPSYPGPRDASAREIPVCPRPFTYPSNAVSHRDIDPTHFTKL